MGDFAKVGGVLAAPFTGGASLWLTAAATGLEVYGTMQAAKAQRQQLLVEQKQEAMAATDREVQRQRRLNAILGSQAASAAAAGVANSGSVGNISLVDARRAAEDSLVDQVGTGQRIRALRSQSRSIGRAALISAGGTILSAGQKIASRGSVPATGGAK